MIPNLVEDKKHYEDDDTIEEKLRLWLNEKDIIQLLNNSLKQSYQSFFSKSIWDTQQSTYIKNNILALTNIMYKNL